MLQERMSCHWNLLLEATNRITFHSLREVTAVVTVNLLKTQGHLSSTSQIVPNTIIIDSGFKERNKIQANH
jgi:hypothetical protein